jgi:hypothetical protein
VSRGAVSADRCIPALPRPPRWQPFLGPGRRVKAREATACGLALTRRSGRRQSSSEENGTTGPEVSRDCIADTDQRQGSMAVSDLKFLIYRQIGTLLACRPTCPSLIVCPADDYLLA